MKEENKLHWYLLNYRGILISSGVLVDAGACCGYSDKKVTLARINEGKDSAGVCQNAMLISVCYLGFMTKDEFTGE